MNPLMGVTANAYNIIRSTHSMRYCCDGGEKNKRYEDIAASGEVKTVYATAPAPPITAATSIFYTPLSQQYNILYVYYYFFYNLCIHVILIFGG
jgi:hypothetical protein